MEKFNLRTSKRNVLLDITSQVKQVASKSGVQNGFCIVYCPHTTGGITINESYDPAVAEDIVFALNKIVPMHKEFTHSEGNSDSHTKASLIGPSENIIIKGGELMLGRWQGIYLCEFDGPRTREVWVQILGQ